MFFFCFCFCFYFFAWICWMFRFLKIILRFVFVFFFSWCWGFHGIGWCGALYYQLFFIQFWVEQDLFWIESDGSSFVFVSRISLALAFSSGFIFRNSVMDRWSRLFSLEVNILLFEALGLTVVNIFKAVVVPVIIHFSSVQECV